MPGGSDVGAVAKAVTERDVEAGNRLKIGSGSETTGF
jgi:hypothetical protein